MFEFGAPDYNDKQLSVLFSLAQRNVILNIYDSGKSKKGFESSEKYRKFLDQLIKGASISDATISTSSDQTGIHPNGTFLDLPSNFLLFIEEAAKLDTAPTVEIRVKPVTHDEYTVAIDNPYKEPSSKVAWRMDISRETDAVGITSASEKRVEIITNGAGLTDYRIRYLREAPDIVVDETTPANQIHCILDNLIHPLIITEAVKIATSASKPDEYQIAINERMDSEN